jgi:hypothetical protein
MFYAKDTMLRCVGDVGWSIGILAFGRRFDVCISSLSVQSGLRFQQAGPVLILLSIYNRVWGFAGIIDD